LSLGNQKKMSEFKKDKRFAHVSWDPKFREMPRKIRKVKIDDRFSSMFTDPNFKLEFTVDKRGRPYHRSTEENMRKFYDIHSDDEQSTDEQTAPVVEDEHELITRSEVVEKDTDELKKIQEEDDDEEEEEEDEEEMIHLDLARGHGNISSSDSSDDEEEWNFGEVQSSDSDWGELDADAPRTEKPTKRLAICNLDWDRIRAEDLFVLLNSFKPIDGSVLCVKIFPSEFGLRRMEEERISGPKEIVEIEKQDDENLNFELKKNTTEWQRYMRRVRQYQLNRLRYFYAVVECDSAATANTIYEACDGTEYLNSTLKMDFRFVPDEMTFDDSIMKDSASDVNAVVGYRPNYFRTTALCQTKVDLTWDETDYHRTQKIQRAFDAVKNFEDVDLHDLLASSESDETADVGQLLEEEDEDVNDKNDSNEKSDCSRMEKRNDAIEQYHQLLNKAVEVKNKWRSVGEKLADANESDNSSNSDIDMEITFDPELQRKAEEVKKKRRCEVQVATTPWQRYLEKRREKRRQRKLQSKLQAEEKRKLQLGLVDEQEEMDICSTGAGKQVSKEQKKMDADDNEIGELELLTAADDNSNKAHYHLKALLKQGADQKKHGSRMGNLDDQQFQLNLDDPRFQAIYTSHLFNIDQTDPAFKRTAGMERLIEEKRRRRKRNIISLSNTDSP
ncbi:ESF1 -like protein, partial [Trichinella pseudospiralis]